MSNSPDPEHDIENVKANRDQDSGLERLAAAVILIALVILVLWSLT